MPYIPPPEFYPGWTILGRHAFGIEPKTSEGVILRRPEPRYCVGAGTSEDPAIFYCYNVDDCKWLPRERRPYFEAELRKLATKCQMRCIIIRAGPHNRFNKRDSKTGTLKTIKIAPGYYVLETIPAEWHVTIYMGDYFEEVFVQGHVFTCVAPNPHGPHPEKILKIIDDPRTQRQDGLDINMEFWLTHHRIPHYNRR